ncbi:hypothetical protein DH2020_035281 [Rehmannia glutinosa]|uniref:Uncharacterized protein n=1 Tax=Rehmannia glutinosa TaxID=99300 RepID=A0ABR0VAB0_REHGL
MGAFRAPIGDALTKKLCLIQFYQFLGSLLVSGPSNHQSIRVESRPHTRRLHILPHHRRRHLPLSHAPPPPLPHSPHPLLRRPPPRRRRPQRRTLSPLPRHGRRMHTRRPPPDPAGQSHLVHLLPRRRHQAARPDVLLGPRVLLLEDPGVRGHAADPPQWVPLAAALFPPRVPSRGGAGDVLPVAGGAADAFPGGGGDQRLRARANVRILPSGGARVSSDVEENGDGLPDHPVFVRVLDFGFDAVFALYRAGLFRGVGLGF